MVASPGPLLPESTIPNVPKAKHRATFVFLGRLKDFLTPKQRGSAVQYAFAGRPAVKDAMEAIGIPHTEVEVVTINDRRVPLDHPLDDGHRVVVQPRDFADAGTRFVVDTHLGKLARWLRLLGFDTLYRNDYSDPEIVDISVAEGRVALTRDRGLLKHARLASGYWVRANVPADQIHEIVECFALRERAAPFTRCLICNAEIHRTEKEAVAPRLFPRTCREQEEFRHCRGCDRVYWRGSHFARLQALVKSVMNWA